MNSAKVRIELGAKACRQGRTVPAGHTHSVTNRLASWQRVLPGACMYTHGTAFSIARNKPAYCKRVLQYLILIRRPVWLP